MSIVRITKKVEKERMEDYKEGMQHLRVPVLLS